MPASFQQVREFALALPGVTEGVCFGTPTLYVGRTLMARLREDEETLVLKMDPAERARLMESFPDTFFLTDHYRNYPVVLVSLPAVSPDTLRPLVEGAWRMVAPRRQVAAREATPPGQP